MESSTQRRRGRKRAPQRAVPQSIRRSGRPLFFGWGAHLTHHEREQTKERVAAAIGIVIALAIVGILLNGWYQDNIAKPAAAAAAKRHAAEIARIENRKPVATIGSTVITSGWYHKVLALQQKNLSGQLAQYQTDLQTAQTSTSKKLKAEVPLLQAYIQQLTTQQSSLPLQAYQQLIDNVVMEQKGPSAGLRFGASAQARYLHNQIYNQFNGPAKFAIQAQSDGLTSAQLKSLLLMSQRAQHMQKLLAPKVSKTAFEVHVRHILVGPFATQATTLGAKKYAKLLAKDLRLAQRVQRLLQNGGSWKTLALKYSIDGGSKTKGGDYGWVGASTYDSYVPQYKNAALHQKLYAINIIHSADGYHVIEVLGRGQRRLSSTDYKTAQQSALQTWLTKEESTKGYVRKISPPVASPLSGLTPTGGLPTGGLP